MAISIIRQTVTFKTSPHEVYEALMDSKKHSRFTGAPAKISRKAGGKVSTYGGYAQGINLELIPDESIVQSWRASDWKKDEESTVVFELEPVKNGTRLKFAHHGVPAKHLKSLKQGWTDYYWKPLKEMLGA